MTQPRLTRGTSQGFVLVALVLCAFTFAACPANPESPEVIEAPSQAAAVEISVSPASAQIGVGGSLTLNAQVTGGTASERANVTWSSSASGVASVSGAGASATVRGLAAGSASIQASTGGKTASASVTVTGGSVAAPGS